MQIRIYGTARLPSEYERAKYLALNTYAQAGTKARYSPQSGAKLFEDYPYKKQMQSPFIIISKKII